MLHVCAPNPIAGVLIIRLLVQLLPVDCSALLRTKDVGGCSYDYDFGTAAAAAVVGGADYSQRRIQLMVAMIGRATEGAGSVNGWSCRIWVMPPPLLVAKGV